MAPYLATATIGQFDLRSYRTAQGLRMYDAVEPDLYGEPAEPEDPASPTFGEIADASLARQGEILEFLSGQFGPYPFSTGGGIVYDAPDLFFALEVQTRSIYPGSSFSDPVEGDLLVVHENAHQWFDDSVALAEWKHMWLNEGFATYAEWLWGEREGLGTTQEVFDSFYNDIPGDDPFWDVVVGDPGIPFLFNDAVYVRGATTCRPCAPRSVTETSSGSFGPGRPGRPVVTAPPASSSRWPSGSRASSWMTCSTCGCSPPANPARPRRQARPPLFLGPRRASRGPRRQRPACFSACRTERHTWGGTREAPCVCAGCPGPWRRIGR